MNLLFPAMLAGLASLAVPVVLHLIARHRFPVYDFPSIRLLQRDVKTNVFAPRLVDVWQLLLRLALLAMAVLAMTRLVGPSSSGSTPPRNLVVVLDSSASMRLASKAEGKSATTLWDSARAEAKRLLETIESPGRSALVVAGDSTRTLSSLATDPQAALGALDAVAPSDGTGPGLVAAVAQACDMLRTRREALSQIIVLSDLRSSAFEGRSAADLERIEDARRELGDRLDIVFVDVAEKTADNLSIVSAQVRGSQVKVGDDAHLIARISNTSAAEQSTKVRLAVSSRDEPLVKEIKLAPGANAVVDLTTRVNRATRTFAQVHLDPHDALEHDDQFDVPLDVVDYRRVLLVRAAAEDAASASATALEQLAPTESKAEDAEPVVDGATILRYALNPGRELGLAYGTGIDTTIVTPEALAGQPLSKYELVILYDVSSLSESALEDLDTFVRQGRAVLIVCSGSCSPVKFNRTLAAGTAKRTPLSPGQIGNEESFDTALGLAWQGSSHPLLTAFSDPLQGDLSVLRFNKLREIRQQQEGTTVTLALAGGKPLAIERPLGLGRVMLLACGVELDRCNLARARVFPTLMWRLVDYLSGALKPSRPDVLVASRSAVLDVAEPAFALATELELTPVGGEADSEASTDNSAKAPRRLPISQQRTVVVDGLPAGRYVLHKTADGGGAMQVASYSRNVVVQPDVRESNLAKISSDELTSLLGEGVTVAAGVFPDDRLPSGAEWWTGLIALLVLLYALEALFGWIQAVRRQRRDSV